MATDLNADALDELATKLTELAAVLRGQQSPPSAGPDDTAEVARVLDLIGYEIVE